MNRLTHQITAESGGIRRNLSVGPVLQSPANFLPGSLPLRPANQKEFIMNCLVKNFSIKFGLLMVLALSTVMIAGPVLAGPPGTQKWAYTMGSGGPSSAALADDGTIYVGNNDHWVYAINPDGSPKHSFLTGDMVWSTPVIGPDGTVYVWGSYRVYALRPNLTQKWVFWTTYTGGAIFSPAVGADGTIYVPDAGLVAVDPSGNLKWAYAFDSYSSPAIGPDGTIYVRTGDNKLYAIRPDGTQKWVFPLGGWVSVNSCPAIGADGTVYVGAADNKLYAIKPNGSKKWDLTLGGDWGINSSPAIGGDGTIYVGASDGKLYAINPDGSQKWATIDIISPGGVYSSPAVGADGVIYVGSADFNLYALRPDGSQKWAFPTGGSVSASPAIGPDGTIYVQSYDHKLYAVFSDSPGLASSPWPMFHHDLKRTGRSLAASFKAGGSLFLLLGD